eukprot:1861070-Amphidinium_carterae.1
MQSASKEIQFKLQSEDKQNAIRIRAKCNLNANKMQSKCEQVLGKNGMQSNANNGSQNTNIRRILITGR